MNSAPVKVSIIVPVYNVEKYLGVCLHSCTNQTLYDIEIICVNDGSTDSSMDILHKFAQTDNRIKIIDKPNGGLSSARNAGLKVANGQMIMFLDSDDYLSPNACERVWRETLEAPTDVVIFGTNIFPAKPTPTRWHYRVLHVHTHRRYGFTPDVLFNEPNAKPFVWRQAFSKKLFDTTNLEFDETVKYGEDMVFQLEAFPHCENFAFIEDRLYNYRWYRDGSLMHSVRDDIDEKIRKHISFVENICEYWQKQNWFETYGKEYVDWILEFVVSDIQNLNVKCADEHYNNLIKLFRKYQLEKYLKKGSEYHSVFSKKLQNA